MKQAQRRQGRSRRPAPACWSASTRMPLASIAGPRSITWPSPPTGTRSRCARSRPSPRTCTASPTGSVACGVSSVAMESTGVYWIPLYEILEARGLEVVLVNARHVKNVTGRKSDVLDCQWLQELHSVGLLPGSFRPTAAIAALRAYLRHRETLVQSAATHIQRMQRPWSR